MLKKLNYILFIYLYRSNLKNTRTMKNMKKDIIKFQVYDAEEAQQILLYREYGEILNKTLIIQKVNYFEDFVYGIYTKKLY